MSRPDLPIPCFAALLAFAVASGAAAQNAPDSPQVLNPAPSSTLSQLPASLSVQVSDPDGDSLTVTFHGRPVTTSDGPDFTLIEIPDTQYYPGSLNGGAPWIFSAQTRWIASHRALRNIAYVGHVGDIVQNADNGGDPFEWTVVDSCMALLEDPVTALLPEGIPYGAVPGNHDVNVDGSNVFYNQYLGLERFAGRSYYGGHYGSDNSSWFHLFSASGLDFIVIGLKLDWFGDPGVIAWADSVLSAHPQRRGILISHYLLNPGPPVTFSAQGQMIYDALKDNTNLFLMMCGHFVDEARRADTWGGHTIHTVMANYQGRSNGGDGWLRILEFSPANDQIRMRTYSPTLGRYESDPDSSSQFTLDVDLGGGDGAFHPIGTIRVPAGATVEVPWAGLQRGHTYEWYATVSDGSQTVTGPTSQFETVEPTGPTMAVTVPNGAEVLLVTKDVPVSWEAVNFPGPREVEIQISRNGPAGPYETLVTQLPDTGSWKWRVNGPVTNHARIRVVIRNDLEAEVMDISDLSFAITAPPVSGVPLEHRPGISVSAVMPNPTRGGNTVRYRLDQPGQAQVEIVDIAGRRIAMLADRYHAAGSHEAAWDGRVGQGPAPAGLYFVRVRTCEVVSRRFAVIR